MWLIALAISVVSGTTGGTRAASAGDEGAFVTPDELTDQHIEWAIGTLTQALYDQRDPDGGRWDRSYPDSALANLNVHQTGQTTLAVYALLAAGQSYQDPRLYPVVRWLRKQRPEYTYVRSFRCHLWALLPRSFGPELERDAQVLMSTYGYETGSWGYSIAPLSSGYDNSLTQYGTLGLWEAAKRGKKIPDRLWKRIEDHYLRVQLQGGGWNYRPGNMDVPGPRGSMTAAGLTALFITQDFLHAAEHLEPAQPATKPELAIEQGLQWLDANFTVENHPGAPGANHNFYYFYYLYGIERVGLAGGIKRFGGRDWFRDGAASIINRLCEPVTDENGSITGFTLTNQLPDTGYVEVPVVQLSFALMFLAHGRSPIVVSKLQDGQYAWNNRPRDAANLARWLSSESERQLGWQTLNVNNPLADWLESPIVYLSSHEAVPYAEQHLKEYRERNDDQRRKQTHDLAINQAAAPLTNQERIKQYLDAGGFLLTSADIGSEAFTRSIVGLGSAMYPDAHWRTLPADHWAYTLSTPVRRPPELFGLSNGVRELIIHAPSADFGAALQINDRINNPDHYATLTNIYLYATQRGLLEPRLAADSRTATLEDDPTPTPTRTFTVWRGVYEGNWNPEPGADLALGAWLKQERNWALNVSDVPLADLDQTVQSLPGNATLQVLLWIRGVDAHQFTPSELEGLRQFTQRGGTVLLETVGGLGRFAAEAEQAMISITARAENAEGEPGKSATRNGRFRSLGRHSIVTGQGLDGSFPCSRVSYRLYTVQHLGSKETRPRLRRYITSTGQTERNNEESTRKTGILPRILSSREDMTYAQLARPRWGISGYETDDARRIMTNLLIFSHSNSR
ncbi:MAG: hypothetical protein D8M59_14375 [Planctomycetes bacterium]|nr:hypothetical protein [Planctomycetota bacterium]NOG55516.1 hypothetical protein [Planctomycetota bacterium]